MTSASPVRCALALAALVFASACASRAVPVAQMGGRHTGPDRAVHIAALPTHGSPAPARMPEPRIPGRASVLAEPVDQTLRTPPTIPATRIPVDRPARKNAVTGFVLEYLIPGAGQLYAGNERKAVNVLGIIGAAVILSSSDAKATVAAPVAALAIGARFWSLWDVPASINKANRAGTPGGT